MFNEWISSLHHTSNLAGTSRATTRLKNPQSRLNSSATADQTFKNGRPGLGAGCGFAFLPKKIRPACRKAGHGCRWHTGRSRCRRAAQMHAGQGSLYVRSRTCGLNTSSICQSIDGGIHVELRLHASEPRTCRGLHPRASGRYFLKLFQPSPRP